MLRKVLKLILKTRRKKKDKEKQKRRRFRRIKLIWTLLKVLVVVGCAAFGLSKVPGLVEALSDKPAAAK